MDIDMIGPAIVLGLGCLGSSIGCGIAGMASHGVMTRVEEGPRQIHRAFGDSLFPVDLRLYPDGLDESCDQSGNPDWHRRDRHRPFRRPCDHVLFDLPRQVRATAIQASAKQPAIFGKTLASLAIVESFALFAFVFAILLI